MKNNVCLLLNILYSLFEVTRSQYIMMNRKPSKSNQCDPNNNLVEQFFNVIFTEFHHTQPVCVCVQMCIEKPTYCYPNGCLRKLDRIKEETTSTAYPVNRIQYDSHNPRKSVMFLVDNDKDLIDNIFDEPRINSHSETKEKISSSDLVFRPNPFKELVFKNRKLPKLEMRYNLREKVKNAQSEKVKRDKVDVSKTRWPMNKHLMHSKQLFNRIRHYKKDDDNQRTMFISMFPELESANNVAFNKRLLTKREDNKGVNIDSLYIYKTDANFSIENLIDDLIINSLDDNDYKKNKAKVHINENKAVSATDVTLDISDGNSDGNFTEIGINDTTINKEEVNTNVDIVLINSTNYDVDTNKYIHDSNVTNNDKTYLEEITNMAERIEKNNNVSIEFVKHVVGLRYFENDTSPLNTKNSSVDSVKTNFDLSIRLKQNINNDTLTSTESNNISVKLTAKRWTAPVLKTKIKQKSKQRIVRKLDRKIN